jgi:tetratricopeptide (TPR) repeat protein
VLNYSIFYYIFIVFISVVALLAPQLKIGSLAVTPETFKTAWSVALIPLMFLFWILHNGINYKTIIVKSPFYYPILGFITWCFISLAWVTDGYLASIQLIQFTSIALIFFIVLNTIRTKKDVKQLLFLLVITSILVSILGLVQYYFPNNINIQNFIRQAVKPASTFGNKNMAIHFIVMTLPIAIVFLLRSQKIGKIVFFTFASVIASWYLIHSYTRAGWLSVTIEMTFLSLFLIYDFIKNKQNPFLLKTEDNNSAIIFIILMLGLILSVIMASHLSGMILTIFIILIFILIALIAFIMFEKTTEKVIKFHKLMIMFVGFVLWFSAINYTNRGFEANFERVITRVESITPKQAQKAGNERVAAWTNTVEMIKDNLFIGVGAGQWPTIYPLYYDKKVKDRIFNEKVRLRHLHNDHLELLANFGIIGFSFLLWLAFLVIQASYKILNNVKSENRYLVLGMVLALTGFANTAIFTFPIKVYAPMLYAFVFMALIANISFRSKGDGKGAKNIDKQQKFNHVRGDSSAYFILDKPITKGLLVFALILTILAGWTAYHWTMGEHYFHNTQAIKKGIKGISQHKLKLLQIKKSLEHNPFRAKTLLLAGSAYLNNGQIDKGIAYFQDSLKRSPYQTTPLLALSQAYRAKGDEVNQLKTLETFMEIDPKSVRAYARAAILYARKRDQKKANLAYHKMKLNFRYFLGRDNFGPYFNEVGRTAKALGDYQFAKYVFSQGIKLQPKQATHYKNLGMLYYNYPKNKAEKSKGIIALKYALKINPRVQQHKEIRQIIKQYQN